MWLINEIVKKCFQCFFMWFLIQNLRNYRPESQNHATGHISLKQTAYTRGHYETPSYLKNNAAKEPQITGYVPYSPYSLRRREINRALCATSDDQNANIQRSYSPYRQYYEKDSFGQMANGQSDEKSLPSRYSLRSVWNGFRNLWGIPDIILSCFK